MRKLETPSSPLALFAAQGKAKETGEPASKTPLVLGHALGSSHEMWQEVLEHLPADLPVVLWDQPGHGESELLNIARPTAIDTARALNNALLELKIERAHIVGLSLGGLVSLAYAATFPEETASLGVLDSGPANQPSKMWLDRAAEVDRDGVEPLVGATMERWFTPAFASGSGAARVTKIRDIFVSTDPAGYAQCCRILAHTDMWPSLRDIKAPALVLTGEDDAGMTPEAAAVLAERLAFTQDVVIVPDARHLTAVEQPFAVADAIQALIVGSSSVKQQTCS